MSQNIDIGGKVYFIEEDPLQLTLADSFSKNKIGTGHGEAKLYIGNENDNLKRFFNSYSPRCFFKKSDLERFLHNTECEFINPQQEYLQKAMLPMKYDYLRSRVSSFKEDIVYFYMYRANVTPPRVYLKSDSQIFELLREICLPNISYLSILKLNSKDSTSLLYFNIFSDFNMGLVDYQPPNIVIANQRIKGDNQLEETEKEALHLARVGQGVFRKKVINDCVMCPFTKITDPRILIASHIKPWADSTHSERLNPKNGLLLSPTFDILFDKGFITFTDDKKVYVSPWLSHEVYRSLSIYNDKLLPDLPLDNARKNFLKYHRDFIFKK